MKKKISKKTKEMLVGILVALGSYIGGIVSVKNPVAGKVIDTVVDIIGSNVKDSTNVTWEQN